MGRLRFPVDPESLKGRVCYGGLDLSSTTDITAFVLVFPPEDDDDKYIVLPYFWLPADNIPLRVRRDHVFYDVWERQGLINTHEGTVIHYDFVEKFIEDLGKQYNIREIAFDRWVPHRWCRTLMVGIHRCPVRPRFYVDVSAHERADEARSGEAHRPWW
jgi:phage terminase large subunit-like protein